MGNKKKVVVLPGGKWQIPLIKRLKLEGHQIAVIDPNQDAPAFAYADSFRQADIFDKAACLSFVREFQADAIMSEECDIAVPVVAYLSEQSGLRSISSDCAGLYTDKYKMREFSAQNGFLYPEYRKCGDLETALDFYRHLGKTMIMKPLDANSSRGVYTINSEEELKTLFSQSLHYSRNEKAVLCERYIEGTEFTVDGIMTDYGHVSLAISEKRHYSCKKNIARSLVFTHYSDNYDYDQLRKVNDSFVEKSGLSFGLTHAEYKLEQDRFLLIETAARGGGNLISSHIVPRMSGVDNYGYLINKTLGLACEERVAGFADNREGCMVLAFFDSPQKKGTVKNIRGIDFLEESADVIEYRLNCKVGDMLDVMNDDSQRIGFYIAYAESKSRLELLMKEIDNKIRVEMSEDEME